MAQWIGYMVSIKCNDNLGTYQGEIQSATNTHITLTKAFCNGFPCTESEVKIRACDIADLKLIEKQSSSPEERSIITIAKPIAKRAGRTQSTSESTNATKSTPNSNSNAQSNGSHHARSKPIDIEPSKHNNYNSYNNSDPSSTSLSYNKNSTPNRRDRKGPNAKFNKVKDEECFGSPIDERMNKEFDFQKNLRLFDKQGLFNKLNANKPEVQTEAKKQNYKHNENVIATVPTTYRQITVPKQEFSEYVTDDGLIIPSIPRLLRKKIDEAAEKAGLTWDKRIELMGRGAAEISIQLLGGAHRLNPHNSHQWPTVVALCGPHNQGAAGVNTARQLASQGISTVLYISGESVNTASMRKELQLYKLTKNQTTDDLSKLPNSPDLIICSICDDSDKPFVNGSVLNWLKRNRAPILALDPPPNGIPSITPKCSIIPVLPLAQMTNSGKLYLCNLGFPVGIFNEVGIKYKSPFGSKFVIPLHPKNE